jgi:hypothetical protein
MKVALLLSGLQRNFEPFIQNQMENIIKKYNCDVFIYTSSENSYRYYSEEHKDIFYKQNDIFNNNINFFKDKYDKYLKNIYIDENNESFEKFKINVVKPLDIDKTFHINLISAYFKVHSCVELMENYEKENNVKYDIVFRMRLDGFTNKQFFNTDILNLNYNNNCYMSITDKQWRDDCCVVISRNNIDILKKFVFHLISIKSMQSIICVEHEIINFLRKNNMNINFIHKFVHRIGGYEDVYRNVPYLKNEDFNKLYSPEYKLKW